MKVRNIVLSAATVLLTIPFSGCSIFDKSPKYVVKGSSANVKHEREDVAESAEQQGPVLAPPSAAGQNKTKKTSSDSGKKAVKNKKQKNGASQSVSKSELDSARREAADAENSEIQIPSENGGEGAGSQLTVKNNLPSDFSIDGEWTVFSVRDNLVSGEERPYITFDLPAKRFYGSNGCNIVNGDLQMASKGELQMTNVISTMKMCEDAPFEYLINLAISDVKSYTARQEGPITFLDLKGEAGNTVMVLRRHNMDFLNGAWKITALNGTEMSGEPATMTINITDMQIHGTTGCNMFNGALFIDPDKINSMQFLNLATTRKACPADSRETEFLLALESVETARLISPDTIAMFDPDGNELFKMTRINLRPDAN